MVLLDGTFSYLRALTKFLLHIARSGWTLYSDCYCCLHTIRHENGKYFSATVSILSEKASREL